jgi:histidyl-tRNA synthetase
MQQAIERVRGFHDLDAAAYRRFSAVIGSLLDSFRLAGFEMVDVPLVEQLELYLRKNGAQVLSKLYGFTDQGRREVALRPEFTASVIRALASSVVTTRDAVRVAYSGPVFRYEKPQRATSRQFTQAGVELLGEASPAADADIVALACRAALDAGVPAIRLVLGHLGPLRALLAHLNVDGFEEGFLLEHLEFYNRGVVQQQHVRRRLGLDMLAEDVDVDDDSPSALATALEGLSPEAARDVVYGLLGQMGFDLAGNTRSPDEIVERVLQKAQRQAALRGGARRDNLMRALEFCSSLGALLGEPHAVLADAEALLRSYGVPLTALRELRTVVDLLQDHDLAPVQVMLAQGMARGIAYYSGLIFELYAAPSGTGAIDDSALQICGGGRYDALPRALTGRHSFPALGFAFGVERVLHTLSGDNNQGEAARQVAIVYDDIRHRRTALRLAAETRDAGIVTVVLFAGGSRVKHRERLERSGYHSLVYISSAEDGSASSHVTSLRGSSGVETEALLTAALARVTSISSTTARAFSTNAGVVE